MAVLFLGNSLIAAGLAAEFDRLSFYAAWLLLMIAAIVITATGDPYMKNQKN